jgi:DNA-binding transcriptional ArsR family regulator
MVEHLPDDSDLDGIFKALAHPIRRDILEEIADDPQPIGALAEPFDVSLAAVSKHVAVLEDAGLIDITEEGRIRRCHLNATPLGAAFGWLTRYRVFWEDRFDDSSIYLEREDSHDTN